MTLYRGRMREDPRILDLGHRCRWVISLTLRLFYPRKPSDSVSRSSYWRVGQKRLWDVICSSFHKELRIPFFWDMSLHHWVVGARVFEGLQCPYLHWCGLESQCRIPEEWNPQPHCCEKLGTPIQVAVDMELASLYIQYHYWLYTLW